MKLDERDFEPDPAIALEAAANARKEERRHAHRRTHILFMVFGVLLKFGAVILSLVTLIIHGATGRRGHGTHSCFHTYRGEVRQGWDHP